MATLEATRAAVVVDGIFDLDEPWRTRFVKLVARYVERPEPQSLPSKSDVLTWLRDDYVRDVIQQMLRTWNHET